MASIEDGTAQTVELRNAIDDLALQVMLRGVDGLERVALVHVSQLAADSHRPDVAKLAKEAETRLGGGALSDADVKDIVSQMQSQLATTVAEEAPADAAKPEIDKASVVAFEEDPELLADFVLEAEEHLATIEEKIMMLEKDPSLIDVIHAVFRSFHSIKGLAGFLGLSGVQAVAHEVETLLDHARNLRLSIDSDVVDLVLESSEYLKEEVALVQAKLSNAPLPSVRDNSNLLHILTTATADAAAGRPFSLGRASAQTEKPEVVTAAPEVIIPAWLAAPPVEAPKEELLASQAPSIQPPPPQAQEVIPAAIIPTPVAAAPPPPPPVTPAPVAPIAPTPVVATTPVVPVATPPPAPAQTIPVPSAPAPKAAPAEISQPAQNAEKQPRQETASTSIRVETSKLDRLMDMVGEMVIAQSILSNIPQTSSTGDVRVASEMSQLARITSEVQRCAMSMRMMPIGPLFQKNAKLVRDLSRRNGKQVSLELSGEATELDKSIAEELSDPLLHMIRNSMDHGIEEPDERAATGKSQVALVKIGAEHRAGQIVISISDDGRGLDPQRIRNKAIQNGLIDANAQLSEDEIFHLIFAPGFSTAEKITDISGRGVGMDVVRQHVESMRGRIEIKSELGKGTTFRILLPLTLAIIEGLVIVVGEHRYIIPLFSVREMFRPTAETLFTVQGSQEMILMRGALLPLIRLHKRFAITPRTDNICEGLLVVCEFSGKLFCLFVDDLLGRQEVVIKSLDEAFKTVKGIVGSAILGDGRIGLILDVAGIFHSPHPGQESLPA